MSLIESNFNLRGRKVLIVGLGASGVSAARLCASRGANVIANDASAEDRLSTEAKALAELGVDLRVGGHDNAPWQGAELIVVSPGVPPLAQIEQAARRGIEVIGELELGSRCIRGEVVVIGGTNGKSTTTTLVAQMLEAQGLKVFAGGNLGTPLSEAAMREPFDRYVLEVSSFQTERIPSFHPHVAALLNITDDHLDRYATFDAYAAAKGNIFLQQTEEDVAVIPKGDLRVAREAARGDSRIVHFGGDSAVSVKEDAVVDRLRETRYPLAEILLSGSHNLDNVCAAIACAAESGAKSEAIAHVLRTFAGLPHRTTHVAKIRDVDYFDDSKGTNVGASVAAVRGLPHARIILIAGGKDKGGTYRPLVDALNAKHGAFVLFGEAADKIEACARGIVEAHRAGSLQEAVRLAGELARAGDAVLLSPACSSFDMFRDYADRGDSFAREVKALQTEWGGLE